MLEDYDIRRRIIYQMSCKFQLLDELGIARLHVSCLVEDSGTHFIHFTSDFWKKLLLPVPSAVFLNSIRITLSCNINECLYLRFRISRLFLAMCCGIYVYSPRAWRMVSVKFSRLKSRKYCKWLSLRNCKGTMIGVLCIVAACADGIYLIDP